MSKSEHVSAISKYEPTEITVESKLYPEGTKTEEDNKTSFDSPCAKKTKRCC